MRLSLPLAICTVALSVHTALADPNSPLPLTYETFEAAIAHTDLETCPQSLAGDDRFCRATLAHDEIHVFAFSTEADQPMIAFASFEASALPGLLN